MTSSERFGHALEATRGTVDYEVHVHSGQRDEPEPPDRPALLARDESKRSEPVFPRDFASPAGFETTRGDAFPQDSEASVSKLPLASTRNSAEPPYPNPEQIDPDLALRLAIAAAVAAGDFERARKLLDVAEASQPARAVVLPLRPVKRLTE